MSNHRLVCACRNLSKVSSFGSPPSIAARVMRHLFRGAKGEVLIKDFDQDLQIRLDLSEHMQSRIFWLGFYNRGIVSYLDRFIKPGMVVLDVGANIGEITLALAKRVTAEGKVIAFEPVSYIAKKLEKNVLANNFSWVVIEHIGLSDHEEEVPIFNSCGQDPSQENNEGLGTLYPDAQSSKIIEKIKILPLDQYMKNHVVARLDLLKIDIEGAELACLKGARSTIEKLKPQIIVEVQKNTSTIAGYDQREILDFLTAMGYTFQKINPDGVLSPISKDSLVDFQNILCVPKKGQLE